MEFFIDLIQKALAEGAAEISVEPGFYLKLESLARRAVKGSIVYGKEKPRTLVSFVIVLYTHASGYIWEDLHAVSELPAKTDITRVPSPPFIAVSLHPELEMYPDAAQWLGDFERCLAWGWLSLKRGQLKF